MIENGGKQPKKHNNKKIKCPFCGFKNSVEMLTECDCIERFNGKSQITCMECSGKFSEK